MSVFPTLAPDLTFPALEERVLDLWQRTRAFQRSVEQRPVESAYVFYDGPPFATGLPHYGHLVASTLKDIVPRYWAMRGHRVERRFGWDTHGLPVEMGTEQALGLAGPRSIREYGVDRFNEACRASVLKYTKEWERIVTRLGRWVDFDDDYKTMDPPFMESVWWVFSRLWEQGLVYRDLRVMPFSWRLSTSLSNFEANLDYREVEDPSITIRLRLIDDPDDAWLLVWTTTPWTLPSNLAVAVGEDLTYARVRRAGEETVYVVAEALAEQALGKQVQVLSTFPGRELLGRRYAPLFPYFEKYSDEPVGQGGAFFVIASDDVSEEFTGLVHMAPAYGEADFEACRQHGMPVVDPIDDEGCFTEPVSDFAGQHVKDADPRIMAMLEERGVLVSKGTIVHSYPFCWRSGTPLIYKTVPVWFVRASELRSRMVELNREIHWVPEVVGSKRFGNWLADARDWNVSRSRFWGTPIPVWTCKECGAERCIGSIAELEEGSGERVTDLHPHRIDHLTIACGQCGGTMRRIAEVFDCWFESGAMPYAQSHYPFEGKERFEEDFPAEFIAEGLDQTRGWFYTLLVLSTGLFDSVPFRNVVVNGLILAEDGSKMSKSKRNFPDPAEILDSYGADALRAYLIDSPVVRAEPLRFQETGVRDVVRTVLLPLRNAWSFFVQYANADGWQPGEELGGVPTPPAEERPELDRWILSVLQSLVREVNEQMEGYYLYRVVPPMVGFIDHLTNWYIRRSRRRFWREADDDAGRADKAAAYASLYEVLVTFAQVVAPVLPFMTEALYQDLVVASGQAQDDRESIHLCDYPRVDASRIDARLEEDVARARAAVGLGRTLRERHQLKTRQPLARVTVVHHDGPFREAVARQAELLCDELNVKALTVMEDDAGLCDVQFKANFRRLGPRVGKRMKEVAKAISGLTREAWTRLRDGEPLELVEGVELSEEDVCVSRQARGDMVIASEGPLSVALDTTLDDALRAEGLAREALRRLQTLRKESGLAFTDRIRLGLHTDAGPLRRALEAHAGHLAGELLAVAFDVAAGPAPEGAAALEVEGYPLSAALERATCAAETNGPDWGT